MALTPRTGDRYTWHGIAIVIGEVDPGGRWAMIHCEITRPRHRPPPGEPAAWVQEWDKQQPTPKGTLPADWEPAA